MKVITLNQIKTALKSMHLLESIAEGFIQYSKGNVVLPPVGELHFENPPGDVHIKYGYIRGDDYYVIKIASSFYDNPKINLPSSNGLMLLCSQKTGEIQSILMDEGYLTNVRTAVAGSIVAKYLAPKKVSNIGIIGTGTQARLQLLYLKDIIHCKDVIVFGRNIEQSSQFKVDMEKSGFDVTIATDVNEIPKCCNYIVSTTPSTIPILFADKIIKGTHITAVGADASYKQELDEKIFGIANVIVADSISQCIERGDIAHAIKNNIISASNIIELGNIISGISKGRMNDEQITVADLTGLAIQDIQIAKAVYKSVGGN